MVPNIFWFAARPNQKYLVVREGQNIDLYKDSWTTSANLANHKWSAEQTLGITDLICQKMCHVTNDVGEKKNVYPPDQGSPFLKRVILIGRRDDDVISSCPLFRPLLITFSFSEWFSSSFPPNGYRIGYILIAIFTT